MAIDVAPADLDLIFDRGLPLIVGRVPGVNHGAHWISPHSFVSVTEACSPCPGRKHFWSHESRVSHSLSKKAANHLAPAWHYRRYATWRCNVDTSDSPQWHELGCSICP